MENCKGNHFFLLSQEYQTCTRCGLKYPNHFNQKIQTEKNCTHDFYQISNEHVNHGGGILTLTYKCVKCGEKFK